MNKHILTYAAALAMMFVGGGCDDYNDNFDGLQDGTVVKDVKNIEMTLTEEEYKAIANNSANKALAKADGESKELGYLATDRHFSETITAAKYLPNYLAALYPTADNTSSVKVTSRTVTDLPEALSAIRAAGDYTVTAADYQSVWADVNAAYFTPSKAPERYIPGLLKAGMKDAAEGDYAVVSYQWSDNEPTTGGEEVPSYNKVSDVTAEGTYTLQGQVLATYEQGFMLGDGTGAILVYAKQPSNFAVGETVDVSGSASTYNGMWQIGSPEVKAQAKADKFAYPAATAFDGAKLKAYIDAKNYKPTFISVTGKLKVTPNSKTGYNDFDIEVANGNQTILVRPTYTNASLIDPELAGQTVTATGYTIGVYKTTSVNIMCTDFTVEGATESYIPVGVVLANGAQESVTTRGVVTVVTTQGFMLCDGTGSIYVYTKSKPAADIVAGTVVSVKANAEAYNKTMQLSSPTVTATAITANVKFPTAVALTGEDLDNYIESSYIRYVTYTGTLKVSKSGNFFNYNVKVDDAATAQGSIYRYADEEALKALDGKKITVTGYLISLSGGKYVNTVITSVEEATAAAAAFATRAVDTEEKLAVYYYDGSKWAAAAGTLIVNPADYTAMGLHSDFSSSNAPEKYLPDFLRLKQPYAQPEASVYVAYAYYNGKSTERRADEYVFDGSAWVKNAGIVEQTDQFIKNNGKWVWDPSVTIVLTPGKNQPLSTLYFQACVDWVKANVEDGAKYVSSYGNNDYYSGASAYQGNLDWRPNSAREQYAAAFEGMNDEQITALLKERTIEVLGHVLTQLHPEAKPVEGVEVLYNIQLGIYTGTSIAAPTHQLTYKVIGDAEFEFVSFDTL